jgi:hypothetical protein
MIISLSPDPPQKEVQHVIVLCSDCKAATITAEPRIGTARQWDGLLICDDCAVKRRAAMKGI